MSIEQKKRNTIGVTDNTALDQIRAMAMSMQRITAKG